jgi:two-component system, NtrC family, response regulator AtoC
VARRDPSVITEHHVAPAFCDVEALCATAFAGEHSFAIELPAAGTIELGRGADADVQLVSGGVSRAHARLTMRGQRATVTDLGSRNGTFVNRSRVSGEQGEQEVGHGDEIGIGDARLMLLRPAALPAGVVPVKVRRAFIARVDVDIATAQRPCIFVIQLPEHWYEIPAARDLVAKLAGTAYAGIYNDHILAFAVRLPQSEAMTVLATATRTLRLAGIDVSSGFAANASGDAAALLDAALKALLSAHEDEADTAEQPIVTDKAMLALHEEARRVAKSSINVLLVGETGAGKEVFARAIHVASGRSGPLVCVNTAALPDQLVESELFGYEKGAFSGAVAAKAGLIEAAQGGTLFLDEIGELAMPMQAKLLRVLEDHSVRRVGATTERKVDVRVIAATNCDLEQCVVEKRFRQDLLFRLNACVLSIPPLRARKGEIRRLAEVFLTRIASSMNQPQLRLTTEALATLERHTWPGNVRELRNVIERAAAICGPAGEPIDVAHLPASLREGARSGATSASPDAAAPAMASASAPADVRDSLRDFERKRIIDALQTCNGNQTQAAELLGLPRRTLAYKMGRLGIPAK